jgi:hypothetical protein
MIRIIREDHDAKGVTDGTRKIEQSDAHEPPPTVSVSMRRVFWMLDSQSAPVPGGCG